MSHERSPKWPMPGSRSLRGIGARRRGRWWRCGGIGEGVLVRGLAYRARSVCRVPGAWLYRVEWLRCKRKLPFANGSFPEAQFQCFDDPSAVIHHGHRAHSSHSEVSESDQIPPPNMLSSAFASRVVPNVTSDQTEVASVGSKSSMMRSCNK